MPKARWHVRYCVTSDDGFYSKSGLIWRSYKRVRTFRRASNIARALGAGAIVEQRFNTGPRRGLVVDWVPQ